jgi:putative intracellular protease/amidase
LPPYYNLKDANTDITLASPKGGQPPLDPKSNEPDFQTASTKRFEADTPAQAALANTVKSSNISGNDYADIFYAGGHGPLWDLVDDANSIQLIKSMDVTGRPVAAVCHAPAVLCNAKTANGEPLVDGKKVTGFSNSKEDAVELNNSVPFLLETKLTELGDDYSKGDNWTSYTLTDGNVITGQNPASASAETMLAMLK